MQKVNGNRSLKARSSPHIRIEPLKVPWTKGVSVEVLHCGHPFAPLTGNKIWKLRENITLARQAGFAGVLTFGGAFSNHLLATAYACAEAGLKCVGLVRGREYDGSNYTLRNAKSVGMQLEFIPPSVYADKENPVFLRELRHRFPNLYLIPEGGTNLLACHGVGQALQSYLGNYTKVLVAVGTGGTLRGICRVLPPSCLAMGIAVLRRGQLSSTQLQALQVIPAEVNFDFCFSGYARTPSGLVHFCNEMYRECGLAIEPIYTGKAFFALRAFIETNKIFKKDRVLVIHTGGLQAAFGLQRYRGIKLDFLSYYSTT